MPGFDVGMGCFLHFFASSGASTIIIYAIRICGLFSKVSMLVSIEIVFYVPQILIPFIIIVRGAGATVGDRDHMAWMPA
jgi:hypothetical protein